MYRHLAMIEPRFFLQPDVQTEAPPVSKPLDLIIPENRLRME